MPSIAAIMHKKSDPQLPKPHCTACRASSAASRGVASGGGMPPTFTIHQLHQAAIGGDLIFAILLCTGTNTGSAWGRVVL